MRVIDTFPFVPPVIRFVSPRPDARVATGLGEQGIPTPVTQGMGAVIVVSVTAPIGNLEVTPTPSPTGATPPSPNPNFPAFTFTFSLPLITPSGAVIPAGMNLASLFQLAGSTGLAQGGFAETLFVWFVGGSVPRSEQRLTMTAGMTDRFGAPAVGETSITVGLVPISGAAWTTPPSPLTVRLFAG